MPTPRLRLVDPGERAGQPADGPAYDVAAAAAMAPATSRPLATSEAGSGPAAEVAPATDDGPATSPGPATNTPATEPESAASGPGTPAITPGRAGGGEVALALEPFGRAMTAGERARRVLAHWAAAARHGVADAGRHPWQALRALPVARRLAADVAAHYRYARSRAWVPDGHDGWLLPWAGLIYHATLGALLKAVGWLLIGAGEGLVFLAPRPMRLAIAIVLAAGCWAGLLAGHLL
jgi:hypothetical protein